MKFSHIYVENAVADHPLSLGIMETFPRAVVIPVRHYKDVFSRAGQQFCVQKKNQKIILAACRPPLLYRGAEVCPSFGNSAFFYVSNIMNCIYSCDYCYLQGMYSSANLVVFVDIENVFQEVERTADGLAAHRGEAGTTLYLCNSYDTDLLALRRVIPLADRWIEFAGKRQDILIEMRTKSAVVSIFDEKTPADNVIIAWTLSPEPVCRVFESGAPSLAARTGAMRRAMAAGWRVRICIDPMLYVQEWKTLYGELVDVIEENIDTGRVESVSFGLFRMGKEFLKRARKVNPGSPLLRYPFSLEKGVYTYNREIQDEMTEFMNRRLKVLFPARKVFPWKPC